MEMELVSGSHIPDGLLAAMTLLSEKPRQGVPSWNPAPIQGITEANCTVAIGLRFRCSEIVSGTVVAPSNAAPKKGLFSCGWDALTSNGNGVSLLLDAAGFIPGESQLAAGAQTLVGFTSIANSIVHSDGTGAGLGSTGTVLTVTGVAAEGMGMAWAKAIPVAGYVVNGVASARDLYNTGSDVAKCLSHP